MTCDWMSSTMGPRIGGVDGMDALAVKQACRFAKEYALKNGPIGLWKASIFSVGGFDIAHAAARVAVKFQGVEVDINFNLEDYEEDMKQMINLTEEFVHSPTKHRLS